MPWFDAHLDLACVARLGRDMYAADLASISLPWPPAAVTLPSLHDGGVRWCLATIFTEPGGTDEVGFPQWDGPAAARRGHEQLDIYKAWERDGYFLRWGQPAPPAPHTQLPLLAGILIEGADPIAQPDELDWWADQGVVAIGLSWALSSRYAGGNSTDDPLTQLGEDLIKRMDARGVVHDLSHLSDVALDQLLRCTDRPVIASHSNCRALIDTDGQRRQRHLTDATITEIGRRGGMIGINVFSPFILPGSARDRRATPAQWAAHVSRTCDLMKTRSQVGLGSDMDGGFSAAMMPEGVNRPADLPVLSNALSAQGWTREEVEGFEHRNWLRFWENSASPGASAISATTLVNNAHSPSM